MCFFKKKKTKYIPNEAKFHLQEMVNFRYKGEISIGFICDIYLNQDGQIIYDIQIGGECPAIIKGIREEYILPRKVS